MIPYVAWDVEKPARERERKRLLAGKAADKRAGTGSAPGGRAVKSSPKAATSLKAKARRGGR